MALPLFNPTPEAAAQIRERFTCPHSSLSNIAAEYGTTLDALCAWIATPEVLEPLRTNESVAWLRTRQCASQRMHFVLEAILEMLAGYTYTERKVPMTASLAHLECRERQRSNARRAAHLFYRLSRAYAPVPPSPRSPGRSAESCRGDEGSVFNNGTGGHTPVRRVPAPLPPIEAALALGEILLKARDSQPLQVAAEAPALHSGQPHYQVEPQSQPIAPPPAKAVQPIAADPAEAIASFEPLAPPAPPHDPHLHRSMTNIDPRPADEDHEGFSKLPHGASPPLHPPKAPENTHLAEVCSIRSDISDLSFMKKFWEPSRDTAAQPSLNGEARTDTS